MIKMEKIKVKENGKKMLKNAKDKQNKFMKEFREFALRGSVIDLAVGVLIGGAFQTVVTSFTNNIISPILGCISKVNFSEFTFKFGNLNLTYGAFLTDIINFIIMAFVIFLMIKFMNRLANVGQKKEKEKNIDTKICPHCYSEINIKATRCPYCTSEIELNKKEDEEKV